MTQDNDPWIAILKDPSSGEKFSAEDLAKPRERLPLSDLSEVEAAFYAVKNLCSSGSNNGK